MKSFAARIYPNGEFGIGIYKRFNPERFEAEYETAAKVRYSWVLSELQGLSEAVGVYGSLSRALERLCPGVHEAILNEILQAENSDLTVTQPCDSPGAADAAPLGSSNAFNSTRRAPRGSKGLTSHGRRMLRNGCWLLEKSSRRGAVGMITATIPGCDKNTQRLIVAGWSQILHTFTKWLNRRLKAAGVKNPAVLGVTEIQTKRQEKSGGLPLHLHLVFCSKVGRVHIVTKTAVCTAWKRAVCSVVPSAENLQWNASTRVETVKKSVTRYLCKYLSKGSPEAMERAALEGFKMPSSWWFMVGKMKKLIKSLTAYIADERAEQLWGLAHTSEQIFEYVHKVTIEREGVEFVIGIAGKMSQELRNWFTKESKSPDF